MASVKQHKLLHGVIFPQFLQYMGIDVTKESIQVVKEMFKKHLGVDSLSALSDAEYATFISACKMLMGREYGFQFPREEAELDMKQFLKLYLEDHN